MPVVVGVHGVVDEQVPVTVRRDAPAAVARRRAADDRAGLTDVNPAARVFRSKDVLDASAGQQDGLDAVAAPRPTAPLRMVTSVAVGDVTRMPSSEPGTPTRAWPIRSSVTWLAAISIPTLPATPLTLQASRYVPDRVILKVAPAWPGVVRGPIAVQSWPLRSSPGSLMVSSS